MPIGNIYRTNTRDRHGGVGKHTHTRNHRPTHMQTTHTQTTRQQHKNKATATATATAKSTAACFSSLQLQLFVLLLLFGRMILIPCRVASQSQSRGVSDVLLATNTARTRYLLLLLLMPAQYQLVLALCDQCTEIHTCLLD